MNQDRTPILDAIEKYSSGKPAFFRVPGHRFQYGVDRRALEVFGEKAYISDLTEAEGLDDLHHPTGPIKTAEMLMADLYDSDFAWFLVNGTTCGNEAMLLSCLQPGDRVIVPRNAHKSVLMGLILTGAVPVWVAPNYQDDWHITGAVSVSTMKEALDKNPDARAVFLVSPTYYGISSDLTAIADICHRRGIPLLVDEAHGSHFRFSERLPKDALQSGADLVAQSIHKTAGSMTQSSVLQMKSNLIDPARVEECLKLVMSTSPNYLLMGSLDGARHYLAIHGEESIDLAITMTEIAAEELQSIPGFEVMPMDRGDRTRLVFSASELGISGYSLHEILYDRFGVSCELSDPFNVVAVISWGNSGDDIRRLVQACRRISKEKSYSFMDEAEISDGSKANMDRFMKPSVSQNGFREETYPLAQMAYTPREAFYLPKKSVAFSDAVGKVMAESVIPYPPGIPLIYPGEILSEEIAERILAYKADGHDIHGVKDHSMETLMIADVKEKLI